jgi:hypothetical protein
VQKESNDTSLQLCLVELKQKNYIEPLASGSWIDFWGPQVI